MLKTVQSSSWTFKPLDTTLASFNSSLVVIRDSSSAVLECENTNISSVQISPSRDDLHDSLSGKNGFALLLNKQC